MKKTVGIITIFMCFLIAGLIWLDSALAQPDANCYCRDQKAMWDLCESACGEYFCAMLVADPVGTCADHTCNTYFTYWCEDGGRGRLITAYPLCIDCYPN